MSIVQPTNTTGSFQNQPTGSPVHSVIKTVEFKRGHRVRNDGRTIIYNVKMFFYESKRRLELITGGDVARITAEATAKKTGEFGSNQVQQQRKTKVTLRTQRSRTKLCTIAICDTFVIIFHIRKWWITGR